MSTDTVDGGATAVPAGWEGILEDGEEILWQGQPVPGLSRSEWLRPGNLMALFMAGFGVFWTFTAINMMSGARSIPGGFQLFFPLFGVLFVGMALWGAFGPMIKRDLARRGTYYTLSNRAAYVAVNSGGKRTLRRYPVAEMGSVMLDAAEPGAVYFTTEERRVRSGRSRQLRSIAVRVGFERIPNPREVFTILRDLREAQDDPT